jgi:mannose-1-phosphate guanylyltransferase
MREDSSFSKNSIWAIVLAGGEGKRMCPLIQRWLGQEQPKQYCSFYGSKSLLEYTVDRACRIAGEKRIVTVIGKGHHAYLPRAHQLSGRLLEQPTARGTGPGVLLPLTYVSASDPNATVVILPSDHFISSDGPFLRVIHQAVEFLDFNEEKMVLIGVPSEGPEPEYGWIEPGAKNRCSHNPLIAWTVNGFVEKPAPEQARHCYSCGYFWNTMIVVTRVETLWSLVESLHPAAVGQFKRLRQGFRAVEEGWISEAAEELLLSEIYSQMPEFDFSRDILAPGAKNCLVVPLQDVTWNDLGSPDRLAEVLETGEYPLNIPMELLPGL